MIEVTFAYPDGSEYVVRDDPHGDFASPGTGQKMMRLIESVRQDGWPEMNVYDRACFIAMNSRICRRCGCSENNPCISAEGNCTWSSEDLCSFCDMGIPKTIRPYSV